MTTEKRGRGQPKRGSGSVTFSVSMSVEERERLLAASTLLGKDTSEFVRDLFDEWCKLHMTMRLEPRRVDAAQGA